MSLSPLPYTPGSMAPRTDWREKLAQVANTMRELSLYTDPQQAVKAYAARMQEMTHFDRSISLSRRDMIMPDLRITRASTWKVSIDPWKQKALLPMLRGGLLSDLIYGDEPRIINDLTPDPADPGIEYLEGMRSLMAIPHFDGGVGLNMVVHMRAEPDGFDPEEFPEAVWRSGLFGRATRNLVMSSELQTAYAALDRELNVVADIQRSLLPAELPKVPGLDLAAHYQTSRHAGGDYYDFFCLPNGKWGILIADVSGHGTPAAVIMAILHSIAHTAPNQTQSPARMLDFVNRRLTDGYTGGRGVFVTAFYGIYDSARRTLTYTSAGHNPPRLKRCADGTVSSLDQASSLPLGIESDVAFIEHTEELTPGDVLLFYTDGITEAWSRDGRMFGLDRLDDALGRCLFDAGAVVREVLADVEAFTAGLPATDDRTLLAAQVE